jgi:hypothetical protein
MEAAERHPSHVDGHGLAEDRFFARPDHRTPTEPQHA